MDSIVIFCAKYLFLAVVLFAGLAWFRAPKRKKIDYALAAIGAGILAVILDKIAGKLYYDPRPFVSHGIKPLIAHAADNGFPSEHTLFSVALATVTFFFSKRLGIASFVIALIVGSSRVAAHIHSPIDIFGGIVIGLVAGWAGYILIKRFFAFEK